MLSRLQYYQTAVEPIDSNWYGTSSGLASLASCGSFFCSVGCVICTYLLFSDNKS